MAKQVVQHFPEIPESINITPSKEEMCHTRKNVAKTILQASGIGKLFCKNGLFPETFISRDRVMEYNYVHYHNCSVER